MDLWVVAAAAGVGYAAKANYFQNSTSRVTTESSFKTCSCQSHPWNLLQQIRGRTCPLCRLQVNGAVSSTSGANNSGEFHLQNYGINTRNARTQLKNKADESILKPLEYVYTSLASLSPLPSPSPSPSTYMETVGSLISRGSHDFRKEMESTETQTESFHSQGFSSNDLLYFFVGIAIGMTLIIAYSRREVDNLNEQLNKNENLARDLYEELEMKDHVILKELPNEDTETAFSTEKESKFDSKELSDNKCKNSEAISKIEAELEAELEILEQTMKSSSTLDVHLEFVEDSLSDSEHEASGTSSYPIQTGIYTVPPQELRLRLHEVIQDRLKQQIMELEIALEDSQNRLHMLESDTV
ncbi:protein POLAR-like 1 [Mercurialis annua]|uniref:protein POLAR-like 1 n=1 Tax=Mercurialis annua TaxID=3986 RepID=UPI002160DC27|nr:protein POLAR-like 1 [Mercurialis annua]